jgi:DNA-binding transcriptional MocR family regulator
MLKTEKNQTVASGTKADVWPLFQTIADKLRAAIYRSELGPGHRLPAQRELSENFGASDVVVREALRCLKREGLIYVQRKAIWHGSGGSASCLEQEGLIYVQRGYSGGNFVATPNTRPVQDALACDAG